MSWFKKFNDWLEKPIRDQDGADGFMLLTQKRKRKPWSRQTLIIAGAGIAIIVCLVVLAMIGVSGMTLLIAALLLGLCGVQLWEITRRRQWEKETAHQLRKLSDYHDRLVREAARTRADVSTLKEGLYETAANVEAQSKRAGGATSAESRMIETIVAQLGALGEKPRSSLEPQQAQSQILELEMNPPPLQMPSLSDLERAMGSVNTGKFSNIAVIEMIRYAVRNDAIDIFIQPIVSLPQRKVRLYEIYARLRAAEGIHMPAAHYMELAQKEHLLPAIDNLLLLRCLQMLRGKAGRDPEAIPYVLNITSATLNDRGFMGDLVAFLSQYRQMAARLVFELTQKEFDEMTDAAAPVLDGLSQLGCRFSMDGVRQRRLDIGLLKRRHVRFIKLDAAWLIKEGGTRFGGARIDRLKKQLDAAGIDLIVEKIENDATLRGLLDFHIDFGQGWLFGKPEQTVGG